MSKIQFWKQFTTQFFKCAVHKRLYSICQRYNFESNLQQATKKATSTLAVFDMSKIQFWKQFTTKHFTFLFACKLYSICQRYNFESNLQRALKKGLQVWSCIRYVKDTILKAIYNATHLHSFHRRAVFDMSKIQFWKQFTTCYGFINCLYGCIRYVKDTILKAIYN